MNFSNYISNGLGLQRTNNYRLTSFSMSALRFDCSYGECSLGWDTTSCKTIVRLECCRHTFHKECAVEMLKEHYRCVPCGKYHGIRSTRVGRDAVIIAEADVSSSGRSP